MPPTRCPGTAAGWAEGEVILTNRRGIWADIVGSHTGPYWSLWTPLPIASMRWLLPTTRARAALPGFGGQRGAWATRRALQICVGNE